jgi:hypothetical protein
MGVRDTQNPYGYWDLAARCLCTDDATSGTKDKSDDVVVVVGNLCVHQITLSVFDRALQHEDLVTQTVHLRPGQQDVVLVDAVGGGPLACLKITLAATSFAIATRPTRSFILRHRKPAPEALLPFPVIHG